MPGEATAALLGIGSAAAGSAISAGANYGMTRYQAGLNFDYGEKAANNADARTRALYQDLYSPEAKVQQLKDAGLSVGLMYGTGGASGTTSTQGAQGTGANGMAAPMMQPVNFTDGMLAGKQMQKADAEIENIKADTEGKIINNSNDPVIGIFEKMRLDTITRSYSDEAVEVNKAFNQMNAELTKAQVFSNGSSINISHAEGSSEGSGGSFTMSVSDGKGHSENFNIGGSISTNAGAQLGVVNGVNMGGSVSANYGEGHSDNESHSDGWGVSWSKSMASNIADALGLSKSESGNRRQVEEILQKFLQQEGIICERYEKVRKEANKTCEMQTKHYTEKYKGYHNKK